MKEALMHYYRLLLNQHNGQGLPKSGWPLFYMILPVLLTQTLNSYVQQANVLSDVLQVGLCLYLVLQICPISVCFAVWTANILFNLLDALLFKMNILNADSLNSWPMIAAGIITCMAFVANMDIQAKKEDSSAN
jgi:hypothetical protein